MTLRTLGLLLLMLPACRTNNMLLGRVESRAGSHVLIVTDCYRIQVPEPRRLGAGDPPSYEFTPCRDAAIRIDGRTLSVNGRSCGEIREGDTVLVDHGKVFVNDTAR